MEKATALIKSDSVLGIFSCELPKIFTAVIFSRCCKQLRLQIMVYVVHIESLTISRSYFFKSNIELPEVRSWSLRWFTQHCMSLGISLKYCMPYICEDVHIILQQYNILRAIFCTTYFSSWKGLRNDVVSLSIKVVIYYFLIIW